MRRAAQAKAQEKRSLQLRHNASRGTLGYGMCLLGNWPFYICIGCCPSECVSLHKVTNKSEPGARAFGFAPSVHAVVIMAVSCRRSSHPGNTCNGMHRRTWCGLRTRSATPQCACTAWLQLSGAVVAPALDLPLQHAATVLRAAECRQASWLDGVLAAHPMRSCVHADGTGKNSSAISCSFAHVLLLLWLAFEGSDQTCFRLANSQ